MAERSGKKENYEPLVIFYDSEASNGNVYYGELIEIAATCHPGVVVGSFERLINTKQKLSSFAINECGITEDKLKGKLFIDKVMVEFLDWIEEMVVLARKKNNANYFPVLCAHGGYHFDFLMLFANLERKGFPYSQFKDYNIHFADSFLFCQKLQQDGNQHLQETRLSIDGLFHQFFPKHSIKERHRAMGDVKAMIKIFTQTPLKNILHLMPYSTTDQRVKYFVSQSSSKEQQLILEEKLFSMDVCTRNISSKRLVKEGLTYDILKTVFQKCSSYMDFWQLLKKAGVGRKVARQFTSQFGAMGLHNQGSLGYALNTAIQNGSLSNGSSHDSDGHSNGSVNGNSGTNDMTKRSGVVVPKKGKMHSSRRSRNHDSSESCDVIVTTRSGRATSSSRAFEERPLDYAVTSPVDERPKVCALKSTKEPEGKEDRCNNLNVAKSSESLKNESAAPSTSRDKSICNGSENWDGELENSINRGRFVLQFDEVIPVSIAIEDISSSGNSSTEQAKKAKRPNTGKAKELAVDGNKNCDGTFVQEHENGHTKIIKELPVDMNKNKRNNENQEATRNSVHNKTVKDDVPGGKMKGKKSTMPSEQSEERSGDSSTPGNKNKLNQNKSVNMEKEPNGAHRETVNSTVEEFWLKKPVVQNDLVKTKRCHQVPPKKMPKSVTFVRSKDSIKCSSVKSSESLQGRLDLATVFVGDVPILVPLQNQSVPNEDGLDQASSQDKEIETGSIISNEYNTVSRKEDSTFSREEDSTISRDDNAGDASKDERSKFSNASSGTENRIPSNLSEDDNLVDNNVDISDKQEMDNLEQKARDRDNETPLEKTTSADNAPSTVMNDSLSSSPYETSDTGSNLEYRQGTTPPPSTGVDVSDHNNIDLSGDNVNGLSFEYQAATLEEQINTQSAVNDTEMRHFCDMGIESITNENGDENYCGENRNEHVTEQVDQSMDYFNEMDTSQGQLNDFPECPWPNPDIFYPNPNMFSVPQPQFPFAVPYPTGVAHGMFYPTLPHVMSMTAGPRPLHYPSISFSSQTMVPFVRFPPRFAMPIPMFQPSLYRPIQGPQPTQGMYEPQLLCETHRSSPDVLGIPDQRSQASEQPSSKTIASYSTSSDELSTRSSPFPVDDSFSNATPLTTPLRSPVAEYFPGAQPTNDKELKSNLSNDKWISYRQTNKETRPSKSCKEERISPRKNRNGSFPRDDADRPENGRSRSPRNVKETRDKDVKCEPGSHETPPKPEQLTSPRREERDVKTKPGRSRQSPRNSRNVYYELSSPRALPTYSGSESLKVPQKNVKCDVSPKTSPTSSIPEQYNSPRTRESISSDPGNWGKKSSITPRFDQGSVSSSGTKESSKRSTHDTHKSPKYNGANKRYLKEPSSSMCVPSSNISPVVPENAITSTDSDIHPQETSSFKNDKRQSFSDVASPPSSTSVKKSARQVFPKKDTKPDTPRDATNVTSSVGHNKKTTQQNIQEQQKNNTVKWPQSALATQKYRDPPKPQREPTMRRRVKESHGIGVEKKVESRNESVASRENVAVKVEIGVAVAGEKVQTKEPFSASETNLKSKSADRTEGNSFSRHNVFKKNANYKEVLLGNQNTNFQRSERSVPKREESSNKRERRANPSREELRSGTPTVKHHPREGNETMNNHLITSRTRDQDKSYEKNSRKEGGKTLDKQHNKGSRPVSGLRGSTIPRDSRANTSNQPNRQYDTYNNDGSRQHQNGASRGTKS